MNSPHQLATLLRQTRRPKILVVGDAILDRYVWGNVDRISPEAPIPILQLTKREERLGGAGSVVSILTAMDADVVFATITSEDEDGKQVRELIHNAQADGDCVLITQEISTTVKERIIGQASGRHAQQIARVDCDNNTQIPKHLEQCLLRKIEKTLKHTDAILVSDYKKGVCTDSLLKDLVSMARVAGVPLIADPAPGTNYTLYHGCTCVTPNRHEAELALSQRITSQNALQAAQQFLKFGVENVALTLDQDGIAWVDACGMKRLFGVRSQQVYDVTGAGDAVLSAIGLAIGLGSDWPTAIDLANLAGGLEVQHFGVTPLTRCQLLSGMLPKVVTLENLQSLISERRKKGERIVMTNGCFDLLHPGHVALLQQSREYGDCLIVGINSDQSVRQLKGNSRPVIPEQGRAEMLASLECVDYVFIFDDVSVAPVVQMLRPDVLVKANQYESDDVVGREAVQGSGGKVVLVSMKEGYSTTSLLSRMQSVGSAQ